jgi:uncharacterized protein (DUF697 family)
MDKNRLGAFMPIDMGSVMALGSSLQSAAEIVKVMVGLRDGALLQAKAIELNGIILTAQGAALSANGAQFALLERVRELEKQLVDMEAWGAEKDKYGLQQIGRGAFAYVLKRQTNSPEPPHWICAACYQHGRKSILANAGKTKGDVTTIIYRCPTCKSEIFIDWNISIDYFLDHPPSP